MFDVVAVTTVFFPAAVPGRSMKSVRKGLRAGELERDTYDRLVCSACDAQLGRRDDPDEIYTVRTCPECGASYKQL